MTHSRALLYPDGGFSTNTAILLLVYSADFRSSLRQLLAKRQNANAAILNRGLIFGLEPEAAPMWQYLLCMEGWA